MEFNREISHTHPLVAFGERRGWSRAKTRDHFGIPEATWRQLVTGWTGLSFGKAEKYEHLSGGEIRAVDLMRWHERNRRRESAA